MRLVKYVNYVILFHSIGSAPDVLNTIKDVLAGKFIFHAFVYSVEKHSEGVTLQVSVFQPISGQGTQNALTKLAEPSFVYVDINKLTYPILTLPSLTEHILSLASNIS